jgi:menaquinone-dependent protoporphyrinogen oxidase
MKSKKILIVYASKCGSTGEVAQAIAQTFAQRGLTTDVKLAKNVTTLDGYKAVLVGSATRMGSWLPDALDFVKTNQAHLKSIPTAYFTVHMLNTDDSEASIRAREAYTAPARAILAPQAEVFFMGKIDPKRLSLFDRLITEMVKKSTNTPIGDYRDWDKIRAWAGQTAHLMGGAA